MLLDTFAGMSNSPKRYTVTAALPYANGPLHIGHMAGAYLPADIFVRYLRLHGRDVAFICGSDEHGAAITLRAKKEGITPQQIIDKYHSLNKQAFADFGISFDIFHRTSDPLHYETAQGFFKMLDANGEFEVQSSEQFFDEAFQQFLADRYVMGTCPKCGYPDAYGDQCEKCGSSLNPTDLIHPRSILSGKTPVLKETKHWYLPMQRHQQWLEEWITSGQFTGMKSPITPHNPNAWKPNVFGQCISWLKDGLKSRAMTRDLDWGVPVPVSGGEGKVLYVWLDAPIGYISATRQWAADNGKDWKLYWQNEDTRLIHFIGKDNIVFHCIIFPIILKAHGGYILPDNVPANEFLNLEGDKISTSRNHAVWLHEYLHDFPGKKDELRYVLTSIAPENGDSEFTWKDFQTRVNSELVAILGNFVNRVMVLYHKYFQGVIQSDRKEFLLKANHDAVGKTYDALAENLEQYKFRQALFEVMDLARYGNKYLTENEPWKRFATEPEQAEQTLTECLLLIAHLGACLQPFLPDTAEKIFTMLNLGKSSIGWHDPVELLQGHTLNTPRLLFEKIEDATIEQQIEKLQKAKMENTTAPAESNELLPAKAEIVYDDFAKMDIRVGTILEAQKVPKADKLLQLTIDTGLDKRTVVSGIAEHYQPEEIIGKQVAILVNLAPRKLRGIESQGMILMAKDNQGKLHFVRPENVINPGADIS